MAFDGGGSVMSERPSPMIPSYPSREAGAAAEAWITNLFHENHLDFETAPDKVASPEQVRFIVQLPEKALYYPCSSEVFEAIAKRQSAEYLRSRYEEIWALVERLVIEHISDEGKRAFLLEILRLKYLHDTHDGIMIPSRLKKRLFKIFMDKSNIEHPYFRVKVQHNQKIRELLAGQVFWRIFNWIDEHTVLSFDSLEELKGAAARMQLERMLKLCVARELWTESPRSTELAAANYRHALRRPLTGNGVEKLLEWLQRPQETPGVSSRAPKRILWLANDAGEMVIDLKIIRFLIGWGHKVILVVKDAFYLNKVTMYDVENDPALQEDLAGAMLIKDPAISKKELLERLKRDRHLFVVSDGTQERLNFLLASTTFARVFKEADLVISKGAEQWRRLFFTPFEFTRDIFNVRLPEGGDEVIVSHKAKHPEAVKFSDEDLVEKAQRIIHEMSAAKGRGDRVIFYSAIIGSIPGQMETAVEILGAFVDDMRRTYRQCFVINPAEHFVPGMDADDLMYMWEIVQRSGLIDIWRFQTMEDIETSFGLLNREVPSEWLGKDATYSTGCTKEMNIALEVQREFPEMQIIGPARERFLRRSEYGIGKLYDRRLGQIRLP
jgi:uncharacterized protein with ATP-grasp and redox domains